MAEAVDHGRRLEHQWHVVDDSGDIRKCHRRVDHPFTTPPLAADRMNDLQVAVNGDAGKVDDGTVQRAPEKTVTYQQNTQPVARRSGQMYTAYTAELRGVADDEQQAAAEIEHVLIADEQLLLVLSGGQQGVEDERIGGRSDQPDNQHGALEIEVDPIAWQR